MAETKPVIILIHGLGLKAGYIEELDKWNNALLFNLDDDPSYPSADVRMAYYSDELHPEVHRVPGGAEARARRGDAADAVTDAAAALDDETLAKAEDALANSIARTYVAGRVAEQQSTGVAMMRGAGGAPAPVMLPDITVGEGDTYEAFVRDVLKYISLDLHEPVNAKLIAELEATRGRPVLLLSHSLGTIVSFDVIARSAGRYNIDTWVTMGCPLAYAQDLQRRLPGILRNMSRENVVKLAELGAKGEAAWNWIQKKKDQLGGLFRGDTLVAKETMYELPAQAFPDQSVKRWYNIFDPSDAVASGWLIHDTSLSDDYLSGEPPGRRRVYDIAIKNEEGGAHDIEGYLKSLHTSWVVKDFLLRHT